jgi:histidinol phosphatase-like PHP family hydrolase
VNDRDWFTRHDPILLKRLDYVLADTMIMPMPDDDSKPVKLWLADQYTIEDPEAWMERYMRHNLRVLKEPITILANPTYLPPAVEKRYDTLWTEKRMRAVIRAAVDNGVALEINARSGLPHERFIRLAKAMGVKFTFGTNNFQDRPIDMTRCFEAVGRYGLTKNDMYVPVPRTSEPVR